MKFKGMMIVLLCIIVVTTAGCAAKNKGNGGAADEKTLEVTLYFSDEQAMYVVPEVRDITVPGSASREEIIETVVGLLIEGPGEQGHYRTIPEDTRVRSVSIEGDEVTVDFSQELRSIHGATGEAMALNSLVNTLTEFDYIDKVFFTIEDEIVPLEHFIPDEPLTRNEEVIRK